MTVCIAIADDHKLVRAGLAMLIREIPGYEVVAEAGDGQEALEQALALRPDLILLDIQMPRLSGLDCLARLRAALPDTKVLMLSMHANEEHVRRALELGALGYLLKDATPTELELALRTVLSGNVWLSAVISPHVLGKAAAPAAGREAELTPRQQVVLKRLAEGASVKEIAYELDLSVKTVETYRAQIMERLGLGDLPALVRYAIRNGITQL
ncbi:response regulator transcription factor [Parasulfuritortus cantonensis]|uniref:Response regulator transcription factor n=1 Tax=Parasulfuritortus cantonensis TaxID=2528202 RepID=A0A4R1BIR6_9PROT|nr:response regulator transcription factor [Parasulfuritortus cantonensis]TCJ17186.1 response regulator transcription factor [Parasulfuritortus cantonensis]